ncbi:MAG TPA: hypothetical protein VLF40_04565, partial [Candidatus Saccharimonadales bacterium]|nr:hypothetical protein [Candidatus Saccharimonadales bacterium]
THAAPPEPEPEPEAPVTAPEPTDKPPAGPANPPEAITELWQQALDAIKKQYNTLYGIARMAKPTFDGNHLTLAFKFAFHQKRMNEAKNRKIFSDVIEHLYGQPVEITCVVAEVAEAPAAHPDVSTISNIFGGAEVLES